MKKIKYNLTFWQRLSLPFVWILWIYAYMVEDNECMKNGGNVHDKLKTWHQVKKGMEKHEHKFEYRFEDHGCHYLQCSHEGCNNSIAID